MWILVANTSSARLFEGQRRYSSPGEFEFESLEKIDEWTHEEGRARNQELETDRPGRHYDRSGPGEGSGNKSGWEPAEEPKTHEARGFARTLAERLQRGFEGDEFDALVVAAPPKFLGLMRESTDPRIHQVIESEIGKDLSGESIHDLKERLPDLIE